MRHRRPLLRSMLLASAAYAGLAALAPTAEAAVVGRRGVEIQGPME